MFGYASDVSQSAKLTVLFLPSVRPHFEFLNDVEQDTSVVACDTLRSPPPSKVLVFVCIAWAQARHELLILLLLLRRRALLYALCMFICFVFRLYIYIFFFSFSWW